MNRIIACITVLSLFVAIGMAQPPMSPQGGMPGQVMEQEAWEVSINQMNEQSREKVNRIVEELQSRGGATRGLATDVFNSMLSGGVAAVIDVVTTEVINIAKYKKAQKQKWMQMIQQECNYTDSISSVKGLQDFYNDVSTLGALDPSNINFDGISLRGMREGKEVLYMSCHIDTTRLDNLFRHSKFNLVLDTLIFHPYSCHLPNLQANGIRLMRGQETERDNSFSFNERENLCVSLDMTLTSSWINEAVMVMDNIELGHFKLNVKIGSDQPVYIYSRKQIDANRAAGLQADTSYVQIEGDCFVVPRSYMPISGGKRMWGTGEYNIKLKMRESCQFVNDKDRNKKMKQWYKDYKQMRKMQKKGSQVGEYFQTLWQQNGNTLIKQMLKQGLTTASSGIGLSKQGSGAAGGSMPGGMGTAAPGTATSGTAAPAGTAGAPTGMSPKK